MPIQVWVARGILFALVATTATPARGATELPGEGPSAAPAGSGPASRQAVAGSTEPHSPRLTFAAAWSRILRSSPRLTALAAAAAAAAAETHQAGLLPNPELSLTLENVAGNGVYAGSDSAETTLRLTQPLELGGKRSGRQKLARAGQEVGARHNDLARADLLALARERYLAVATAQQQVLFAAEQTALAAEVLQSVDARIAAGKGAAIERLQFRTLAAEARLREATARQALDAARRGLASLWGSAHPDFAAVEPPAAELPAPPAWSVLADTVAASPDLQLRQAEARRSATTLTLARAERYPDLALGLGAKKDEATGDHAFLAELSLELPLFDRNQGAVAAARSRMRQAELEAHDAQLQLQAEAASAWQQLQAAYAELQLLQQESLPAAQQTFDAIRYGYAAGKFGHLELLTAEQALFAAKDRTLRAVASYHLALTHLERLLGTSLPEPGAPSSDLAPERDPS